MPPRRYHPALSVLHWLIAALILAALVMGTFVMARIDNADPGKSFALLKHMLAGGLVLILVLVRMYIRPRTRRPAPLLSGLAMADRIVPFVHRIFDVLVFIMVGSGLGLAVQTGLPAIVLGGDGALPESFGALSLHALHVAAAAVLAATIALHLVGALYHHFVLRDGLLSRMAPAGDKSRN